MAEVNLKYSYVVDEEDVKDLTYVDRDKLIYFDQVNNLFERLRYVLNDSKNTDTGMIDSHLADFVANRVDEIFSITNNNDSCKYYVSKSEAKLND